MGIFNIKRNHKSNHKSKESTTKEGKSKKGFHLSSVFKFSKIKKLNKNKKQNTKNENAKDDKLTQNNNNQLIKTDDNESKQNQGIYFISYEKRMAISRASDNQNSLETEKLEEKTINSQIQDPSEEIPVKEVNDNLDSSKPKHNENENNDIETSNNNNEEEESFTGDKIEDKNNNEEICTKNKEINNNEICSDNKEKGIINNKKECIENNNEEEKTPVETKEKEIVEQNSPDVSKEEPDKSNESTTEIKIVTDKLKEKEEDEEQEKPEDDNSKKIDKKEKEKEKLLTPSHPSTPTNTKLNNIVYLDQNSKRNSFIQSVEELNKEMLEFSLNEGSYSVDSYSKDGSSIDDKEQVSSVNGKGGTSSKGSVE